MKYLNWLLCLVNFSFLSYFLLLSLRDCVSYSPERHHLHFSLNGDEVTIMMEVGGLRKLMEMDAARADEVLHSIDLLPRVSNPALVACLLKQAAVSESLAIEQHNKLTSKSRRSLTQSEQDKIWTVEHKNKEIQVVVMEVYVNACASLTSNEKLRRLRWTNAGSAHSWKRWLYENQRGGSDEKRSHNELVKARIDDIRNTWHEHMQYESLLDRYGLEEVRGNYLEKRHEVRDKLASKIIAELTNINAKRANQVVATIKSMLVEGSDTSTMWRARSSAVYYRAVVAEFLHSGGVERQAEEARFNYLISDLWAIMRWR